MKMKEGNIMLGGFEELVLLAVLKLGNDGYGVEIANAIEEATGNRVSIGALYTTLSRLEEKGFIRSWLGEATEVRGGRAKKFFAIEANGREALKNTHTVRSKFSEFLTPQLT